MSKLGNPVFVLSGEAEKDIQEFDALQLQVSIKGYNIFLTDKTHCDIRPGDPTFRKLKKLPGVLKNHDYPSDTIRMVKDQFKVGGPTVML